MELRLNHASPSSPLHGCDCTHPLLTRPKCPAMPPTLQSLGLTPVFSLQAFAHAVLLMGERLIIHMPRSTSHEFQGPTGTTPPPALRSPSSLCSSEHLMIPVT
jgi:hypothetical protein